MSEEAVNVVNSTTNLPEKKQEIETAQPVVETKVQTPEAEVKEDPNWRAFREARKKDRLEREAAEKRAAEKAAEAEALKAAMEAILNKGHSTNAPQNHYEEETEEDRIEKKVQAALEKREAEFERLRQEKERQEYPYRLQKNYSDFNQTIAQDNLDYLEYHYPEVARPLQRLQDGYEKWEDIYKAIKKFVPTTNHKKEQMKAEKNYNMPKSLSQPSIMQAGEAKHPIQLDEARKAANWERMQRTLKGIN